MNTKFILLALCGLLGACSTPNPPAPPVQVINLSSGQVWDDMDDVRAAVGAKAEVTGLTLDLKGADMMGVGEPLKIDIYGFTLKNGAIGNLPLLVTGDNVTFKNVVFFEPDITFIEGEAPGMSIVKCKFFLSSTVAVRVKNGRGFSFINSYLTANLGTGIEITGGGARIEDSTFEYLDVAIKGTNLTLKNNTYLGVKLKQTLLE